MWAWEHTVGKRATRWQFSSGPARLFYIDLCFALRSDNNPSQSHNPSQIQLVESVGSVPYLVFKEDVSKTNQSGLQHRKCEQKQVVYYANTENPQCCLICLHKLHQSKSPDDRPDGAFY